MTRLHSLYYFGIYSSVKYHWWKSSFCSFIIYVLHISLMSIVISISCTHIIFLPGENYWHGKTISAVGYQPHFFTPTWNGFTDTNLLEDWSPERFLGHVPCVFFFLVNEFRARYEAVYLSLLSISRSVCAMKRFLYVYELSGSCVWWVKCLLSANDEFWCVINK